MAKKKAVNTAYVDLKKEISENRIKNLYIFHGEERYLLEYYLGQMRKEIIDGGMEEFNYRRFDGKTLSVDELEEAVDTLPVFSQRTMIEVIDFSIFKCDEGTKERLCHIFSDIPEYVCLVFVYDTVEFKIDSRVKINGEIKKLFSIVEFQSQEQSDLTNWIGRRFKALGKQIDRPTAEYLAFISGGLMTSLITEIEKVAAYSEEKTVSKGSIDAVVTPVLDAVTYKLTDAVLQRQFDTAASILSDLLDMQEPPHKIIYSISLKMRQLMAARVAIDCGRDMGAFMDICGIKSDYQARGIYINARKTDIKWCRSAVRLCSETAFKMNSDSSDYSEVLSQLLAEIAVID